MSGGAPPSVPAAPAMIPSHPPPAGPSPGYEGYKTVGYFPNWGIYGRNYQPMDIPGNHITHILYSFANVKPDSGEVYLSDTYADLEKHYPGDSWDEPGENVYGCIKQLYLLKKYNRHLKTLLSIGGWTYSANFPAPASTPAGRQTFARTAVQLLADLGFDGIDIDWEYPQDAAQAQDFVLLLQETRQVLDSYAAQHAQGKRLLLTVAVPCGESNYGKLRMAEMDAYLDFWNLMSYDFAGSWDGKAGHMANVFPSANVPESTPFNADAAVSAYIAGGVHPKKLVFGLPLYGRAFEQTNGPGHSFQGVGEGSWENGVWDYKVLPQAGSEEANDFELLASWSYDVNGKKMISYDTPAIAWAKADYIRRRGLGGGMWWELSGDCPLGSERSLIRKTVEGLGGVGNLDHSMNLLEFPISRFENLKKGFQ
ncbi:chitinase [[Emmonsia] crescens]|uniref:Endochitinase 1 n=1 Tax=[Emmonsia] crescens TaxID=73230 RepID=A0A0G2HRC0_9EURO|nr:chitinase [Emmonsia crescens UAMH 3008]